MKTIIVILTVFSFSFIGFLHSHAADLSGVKDRVQGAVKAVKVVTGVKVYKKVKDVVRKLMIRRIIRNPGLVACENWDQNIRPPWGAAEFTGWQ
jgi:hypothetical protein